MTVEEILVYTKAFKEKEGIDLDPNLIVDNPGKKTMGKRSANGQWGKHGQNAKQRTTELIRDESAFFKLLSNSQISVTDAYTLSDTVLCVQYESKEEYIVNAQHSNVVLAAFTTSLARIYLYTILKPLHTRVLYFDTDSVMFTHKEGEYMPPVGDYLGELCDEINEKYGNDMYISRFLSGGPKNYVLEVKNRNTNKIDYICKVKGITLNFEAKQILNFDSMKEVILNNAQKLNIPQTQFYTDSQLNIFTKYIDKQYRFLYDKRRLIDGFDTVPFGYKE